MKKVALVCDWLTEIGGAEEVLLEFHKKFPQAPIYTSQYRKGRAKQFNDIEVRTGWLNYFPVFSRRFIAPLRQNYFKNLDLSNYDLVISVTGCDAKFVKTNGTHLCFCHVPTQYYWGKYDEYLKNPGFGLLNPLARLALKKSVTKMRARDLAAAQNPDKYITISNFAKQEIKTFYKREAKVVNPPVNVEFFSQIVEKKNMKKGKSQMKKAYNNTMKNKKSQAPKNEQKFYTYLKSVENLSVLAKIIAKYPDGFFLNFSRQVNWKRLDIAVNCCKKLNIPLVIVGNGPENKKLRKLAGDSENITFIDFLPKSDLRMLASLAKAFIFPSKEPFGIAPVEAMAAGCPVIALKSGGALDYIKDGKNGIFFEKQDEKSLETALIKFMTGSVSLDSPEKISKSVEKYSSKIFEKNINKELKTIPKRTKKPVEPTKNGIKKLRSAMILCLPLILFFSNFPVLKFGETDSMHLELSLPLLWLALYAVLSVKLVFNYVKAHIKTPLLAFPIMALISFVHTSDMLRGFLTFGLLTCLMVSMLGLYLDLKAKPLPKNFRKIFIVESLIICGFCFMQALFDRLGVSKDLTLLCSGCISDNFGFAHPNGFTIEPQFMGSLLIAPLLVSLNSLLENKNKKSQINLAIATILLLTTLFFSFSRGAIYAYLLAAVVLILGLKNLKKVLKIIGVTIVSFAISLGLQIALSSTAPVKTVDTVVSQLSLGKVNLDLKNQEFTEPAIDSSAPKFDGYIAESTDRRLELATYAVKINVKNQSNLLFGTGLGSSGTEMYNNFKKAQGHKKEIVQNQYLETLLETGLLGLVALGLTIVTFIKIEKIKFSIYLKVAVLAFAVTILFFSGLPNALHVYLLPVFMLYLMYDKDSFSRV
ncbi:glycosyltransferase [Candidatus Saccharibacteria bacterium]|nr:glycosyltransferase [Candidatus Saccharibacteria bacterium]